MEPDLCLTKPYCWLTKPNSYFERQNTTLLQAMVPLKLYQLDFNWWLYVTSQLDKTSFSSKWRQTFKFKIQIKKLIYHLSLLILSSTFNSSLSCFFLFIFCGILHSTNILFFCVFCRKNKRHSSLSNNNKNILISIQQQRDRINI
ncbi:unnamed protein product [Trifolium pratense]|uniref:Uncharacterized protein n=1 Tax=Trifolium pratense TaxID=57577 RepID=A0ACB0LYL7_TRIPR|nr:unnamed protein product [Trifolium pratense]